MDNKPCILIVKDISLISSKIHILSHWKYKTIDGIIVFCFPSKLVSKLKKDKNTLRLHIDDSMLS